MYEYYIEFMYLCIGLWLFNNIVNIFFTFHCAFFQFTE